MGELRKNLFTAALAITGLLVIAFLLYMADGTPLGMLPVAGVLWVVLAPLPAFIAGRNGRSFLGYLLLSLLVSPIVGIVVVLAMGKPAYLRHRKRRSMHEFVIPL